MIKFNQASLVRLEKLVQEGGYIIRMKGEASKAVIAY